MISLGTSKATILVLAVTLLLLASHQTDAALKNFKSIAVQSAHWSTILNVMGISNVAFDPFYRTSQASNLSGVIDCTKGYRNVNGVRGCGTPIPLLHSAVNASLSLQPEVLLMLGALAAPSKDIALQAARLSAVVKEVNASIRNASIQGLGIPTVAFALGGDDFVPRHVYDLAGTGFDSMPNVSALLPFIPAGYHTTFKRMGCYAINNTRGDHPATIIVLNT